MDTFSISPGLQLNRSCNSVSLLATSVVIFLWSFLGNWWLDSTRHPGLKLQWLLHLLLVTPAQPASTGFRAHLTSLPLWHVSLVCPFVLNSLSLPDWSGLKALRVGEWWQPFSQSELNFLWFRQYTSFVASLIELNGPDKRYFRAPSVQQYAGYYLFKQRSLNVSNTHCQCHKADFRQTTVLTQTGTDCFLLSDFLSQLGWIKHYCWYYWR